MSDTLSDVSATEAAKDPAFVWVCTCPEAHLGMTCVEYWKGRYTALGTKQIELLEQVKAQLVTHRYAMRAVRKPKALCAVLAVLDIYLLDIYSLVIGQIGRLQTGMGSDESEDCDQC